MSLNNNEAPEQRLVQQWVERGERQMKLQEKQSTEREALEARHSEERAALFNEYISPILELTGLTGLTHDASHSNSVSTQKAMTRDLLPISDQGMNILIRSLFQLQALPTVLLRCQPYPQVHRRIETQIPPFYQSWGRLIILRQPHSQYERGVVLRTCHVAPPNGFTALLSANGKTRGRSILESYSQMRKHSYEGGCTKDKKGLAANE
ncbi:hypothetical protein BDV95DRAFT_601799 [Massariosphaeria phaeospora]|uniref:Uncharacterized protein n=1 Tax=Massariosphaeria phaeospora TaxID=100035 RepID=A0A7C8IE79_9PLEO|nr:hypothetical protein BDV95DRAFT_601799 [Massariosphaeria phaeospora]